MIVLVLSDLHIDNGDMFGTFGWKPVSFIKSLEKIIAYYSVDQVILNGDILDLFKYSFKEVYARNYRLIHYFKSNNYIFIRGNHDLFNPGAKDHHLIINSKGNKIYIEHGHNADFLNGTKIGRGIGRLGFYILKKLVVYQWVEKVYFKIVEFDDDLNRIPRKYNSYKYLKYALKLLRKYDMVILGHTHKLESHKMYYLNSKKIYINSGTCSLGRFQATVVDTERLKYETIKIGSEKKVKISDLPDLS